MNSDDADELLKGAGGSFDELLRRSRKSRALAMELATAIQLKDVTGCRELLREKGQWLAELNGSKLVDLMDAAIRSDEVADELVGILLDSGVPAQIVFDLIGPDYQHTPLITAARLGRLDLMQKLVAAGADPFWASPTGANALSEILPSQAWQAPRSDTPEISRVRDWLIQQGVRIDPLCADSRRKLSWASSNPASWPDVPALCELGIPISVTGWTPFMLDLALGVTNAPAVAKLTEGDLQDRDTYRRTPFLLAVAAGDLEVARALYNRGSDLRAIGYCGATALHLAARYNHCHLIEWLLESGHSVDIRDDFGHSALHDAVGADCLDAASLLLKNGADVHERDTNGFGLVHEASVAEDLSMLKLLLDAGGNVNDVSGGGSWPLYEACQAGNALAVSYLLQVGANPNLTSSGETALFKAVSSDSLECVRLLLEAGADVNASDCDGWTCLFLLGSERVAQYLLEHGADPGASDQCGGLPEDRARVPISVRRILRECRTRRQQADS